MNLARIVNQEIPRIVPANWRISRELLVAWREDPHGLKMLFSIDTLDDGKKWGHLSLSRKDRYPNWDEMLRCIRGCPFLDQNRDVVMVIPPRIDYVNVHPNCFHWWQERP